MWHRNTAATYGRQSAKQGNTIRFLNWEIRRWPTHVTSFSMLPCHAWQSLCSTVRRGHTWQCSVVASDWGTSLNSPSVWSSMKTLSTCVDTSHQTCPDQGIQSHITDGSTIIFILSLPFYSSYELMNPHFRIPLINLAVKQFPSHWLGWFFGWSWHPSMN